MYMLCMYYVYIICNVASFRGGTLLTGGLLTAGRGYSKHTCSPLVFSCQAVKNLSLLLASYGTQHTVRELFIGTDMAISME